MVSVYVDDILASGPPGMLKALWAELGRYIDLEDPEDLDRYLGRYHVVERTVDGAELRTQMGDYAKGISESYYAVEGVKPPKPASTPHVSDSALTLQDWEVKRELTHAAAQLVMKALWLSRLCRPDIAFACTNLASQVASWSKNSDKQLYKLMCYIDSTWDFEMRFSVKDSLQTSWIELHVDADLAGCPRSARSTSGLFMFICGPNGTKFPVAWSSKRQSATARSTTEAETISLAEGLFSEAIPLQHTLSKIKGSDMKVWIREDNEATIKIIQKGYSARLRALPRVHRISIAALSDYCKRPDCELVYVDTANQLADSFTKPMLGAKWDHVLISLAPRAGIQGEAAGFWYKQLAGCGLRVMVLVEELLRARVLGHAVCSCGSCR